MRILAFLLFTSASIFPGIMQGQTRSCNCTDNLNKTIAKTEENYAGYPAKVSSRTKSAYQKLVQELRRKAATITSAKSCFYLLKDYINFFYDKHFNLTYYCGQDYDKEIITVGESSADKPDKRTPEGIWINPDTSITIVIKQMKDGSYNALKLSSKTDSFPRGFVYFTLYPDGNQFSIKQYNSFGTVPVPAKITGNLLHIWNFEIWGRSGADLFTSSELQEWKSWQTDKKGLSFYQADAETVVLKIPSFMNNDDKLQALVAEADATIRKTKYLIVDLTGNAGGNSGWVNFLPYFMTNPITQDPSFVRVTPDNVKLKLADIAGFATNPIPAEYQKYFPDSVLNAYKKAYAELPSTKNKFYPVPGVVFPLDSITRFPEKIALLVDNFSGSSAEYFLQLSKQSRKTVSYGMHTVGMMDYEGQSIPTELPFTDFKLMIPIVKSGWTDHHPIDKTGFKPMITLRIPQSQWIEFVTKDIKSK